MNEKFATRQLYDRYAVKVKFRGRLCGGTPRNKEMIAAWVRARTGFDDEKTAAQIADIEEHVEVVAEKSWVGFQQDDKGLLIPCNNVKALMRECMTVLGITRKKRGSKQILQHGFEIKPPGGSGAVLHLGREKPDGTEERAIHVQTAQGKRAALKRSDYCEGVDLSFEVWILGTHAAEDRHVGESELRAMLTLAQENGLGADRSQGNGKFDVVEFAVLGRAELKRDATA